MDDKNFESMDKELMKKTENLREKKVPEGLLKGFSVSVERRILAGQDAPTKRRAWAPAWAPALAVMVLASVAVMRTPAKQTSLVTPVSVSQESEIDDEIAVLKELGAWSESDEVSLGSVEEMDAQILELAV